jgi:hypothetical protein
LEASPGEEFVRPYLKNTQHKKSVGVLQKKKRDNEQMPHTIHQSDLT